MRCAVIGCGLLGQRIAGHLAFHNHEVIIYDRNAKTLLDAVESIEKFKIKFRQEGIADDFNYQVAVSVAYSLNEVVDDVDFVFESICDDLQLKKCLFEELSGIVPSHCVVSTSTLNLNVDHISANSSHKERFLGIRFIYPVYMVPDIELTVATHTSTDTLNRVKHFASEMGMSCVHRKESSPPAVYDEQRSLAYKENLMRMKLNNAKLLPNQQKDGETTSSSNPFLTSSSLTTSASSNQTDYGLCDVCQNAPRNCLFVPCNHFSTCVQCAKSMINRRQSCFMCGNSIVELIRVRAP